MRQLLIFLKYPTPGTVKTRLAVHVGAEAAAEIARACVELTLARLQRFQSEAILYIDPVGALTQAREWLGTGWQLQPQVGATLGERLRDATERAFAQGAQQVVVIGIDSPWLQASDIEQAFIALQQADVVVGPAADGGYYLIGLSQPAPSLFAGVSWSSSAVYAQTQQNAHALRLTLKALPLGYDIDRLEDVVRFIEEERRRAVVPREVKRIDALMQRRPACQS